MINKELLQKIRAYLLNAYHERLCGIVLYGSYARQTQTQDSDIDLLVLLKEPVDYSRDLQKAIDVLYPLSSQIDRRISVKPIENEQYHNFDCPLFRAAHNEGIEF